MLLEQDAGLADVAQAFLDVALEAAAKQARHGRRRRRRQQVPVEVRAQHGRQRVRDGLALEQALAGEHLEQHDAEGPDVGALVGRPPARLLGAHVGRGAEDDAHLRCGEDVSVGEWPGSALAAARSFERLGQAEIEHLDLAVRRDLDVGRLQIAVDDPRSCAASSPSASGSAMRSASAIGNRTPREADRQILAFDEFHDERTTAAGFLEPVDRRDRRMTERGQDLRLPLKSGHAVVVIREGVGQDLDGDVAIEARVRGAVDLAHPARPQVFRASGSAPVSRLP